jgi:hypothetical protein
VSYCSTIELINITGSLRSSTILQAIIDEADRQVTAYLKARGVGALSCDETKSASLLISQAGLLRFGLQEGSFQASTGDFNSSVNVTEAVKALESRAFAILDDFISRQITLSVPRRIYMMTTGSRGRC